MSATTTPRSGADSHVTVPRPRLRRLTRAAGVLYLVIFVVYPLSTFARSSLVVPGDATATADAVRAQETLFRLGLAGEAASCSSRSSSPPCSTPCCAP